jgi:hypothetical protein
MGSEQVEYAARAFWPTLEFMSFVIVELHHDYFDTFLIYACVSCFLSLT